MDEQAQQQRIRLVLVDGQALFRASLSRFLATQPHLEVVCECGTAAEAQEILPNSSVDVALVDLDLRAEDGEALMSAARRAGYQGRFLMVAGAAGPIELAEAIRLGASGIFLKSEPPERLVQAIRLVASGAVWVDPKAIQLLADQLGERPRIGDGRTADALTEKEERVLLGILGGLTNRKIGDGMGLSESNVKSVVQHLFVRAGVRTRSQLVRMAMEGSLGAASDLAKRGETVPAGTANESR
jgi:two-component system, NarL family, nitrate/nitrite response regulator NarL